MSDLAQRYANFNSTRIQAIVDHLRTLNLALLSRKNDLNKVFSRAGVQARQEGRTVNSLLGAQRYRQLSEEMRRLDRAQNAVRVDIEVLGQELYIRATPRLFRGS